jgi:IS30 family transposase
MPPPALPEFRHCAVELIAICRAYGYGIRWFARHLGRSPSTASREMRRNAVTHAARWSTGLLSRNGRLTVPQLPAVLNPILSLVKPRPLSNWSPFSMLGV